MLAPVLLPVLIGAAVASGAAGAMMGLGGGVFLIPILTAIGVDIHQAIAAAIIAAIATSTGAAASYVRHGLANVRMGILLTVATTTGAIAGAWLNGVIPARVLFAVFAAVLAYSALMMFRKRAGDDYEQRTSKSRDPLRLGSSFWDARAARTVEYVPQRVGVGMALMSVAGGVSGLLGIGAGALKVPAMDLAMNLPIKASTATSNFIIGITGLASAFVYLLQGRVMVGLAAPVALGVVAGSAFGARLHVRVRDASMRSAFVVVLAFVMAEMIVKAATS